MTGYINLDMIFNWRNYDQTVIKMQDFGLIPKDGEIKCPQDFCNGYYKSFNDSTFSDGVRWRCGGTVKYPKYKAVKCTKRASIRYNTFFHKSNLPLWKIVAFCHMWVEKCTMKFIIKQLCISSRTATDWASFCREVVFDAFINKPTKIGGPDKIVEIDESKFGKRKYNRGHRVEGAWVFGYERGSGKIFMVVVEDRTATTLLDCIKKFIEPGTTIYSDCWKAYSGLRGHPDYENLQVNHSIHFKDPETGVHTNAIESSWRHAKASGPYSNRQKRFLGGYLARYMFLKLVKQLDQDPLILFFMLTRDLYDPVELNDVANIERDDESEEDDEDEDDPFF